PTAHHPRCSPASSGQWQTSRRRRRSGSGRVSRNTTGSVGCEWSWQVKIHGQTVCHRMPLLFLAQHIADPAHGMHETRLVFLVGLLTQLTHVDLDDVALAAEVVPPYPVKNHVAGEHLTRIAHE